MKALKILLRWIAILSMIIAYASIATRPAQADLKLDPPAQADSYQEVDDYLEQHLHALNIPGASLAIIEGNQVVHTKSFGVSSPDGKAPTPQTPFFICSLTKSFTALAVMQLVETGKIELDAPVQRYLPWFTLADPQAARQVTVRHLLNQTSGLSLASEWQTLVNFDRSPNATEKQARELASFKPIRPVGSAFEYSNTNYNLLGLVIEAASGESYADYVQQHIFDPLGMTHTYTSKTVAKQNGMSSGYISWFGIPMAVPDLPAPQGSLPSGQIISTAEDMAHFLIAELNGGRYGNAQILSPAGIAEMHTGATDATTLGSPMMYGMGWFIQPTSQGTRLWHDGTAPDYFSYMALIPGHNKGLVLLINANELILNFAALSFIGGDAVSLLAGGQPAATPWIVVPWVLRAFLIIPLCQILGVFLTLRALRRWRNSPSRRPGSLHKWLHVVAPSIPNLVLIGCALYFVSSGVIRFWLLYMADLTWLSLICGCFALVWIPLRSGLILSTLRKSRETKILSEQLNPEQPNAF